MNKQLTGLQKVCKLYDEMKYGGILYVWDFVNECAVPEKEMKADKERYKASEKARWEGLKS